MRILIAAAAAAAAVAVAVLAGCGTTPIPSSQADRVPAARLKAFQDPKAGSAVMVVTRDKGVFAGGGCYTAILIDGKVAARLGTGETATFYLTEGRHIYGLSGDAEGGGLCAAQIGQAVRESAGEFKAGETQKFRVSGDSSAWLELRPTSL